MLSLRGVESLAIPFVGCWCGLIRSMLFFFLCFIIYIDINSRIKFLGNAAAAAAAAAAAVVIVVVVSCCNMQVHTHVVLAETKFFTPAAISHIILHNEHFKQ